MVPINLNPGKKRLLIKKNIIVKFDSISSVNKNSKSNKRNDTATTTTFPTGTL